MSINWKEMFSLAQPKILDKLRRMGRNYSGLRFTRVDNTTVLAEASTENPSGGSTTTMKFTFDYVVDHVPALKLKKLAYYEEVLNWVKQNDTRTGRG